MSKAVKPADYYELRGAVVEMFYETLLAEKYTFGQATSRCLVEFRREILGGGRDALVTLATILSRLARHEPGSLMRFAPELENLHLYSLNNLFWNGLGREARERLREDVRFVWEKVPGHSAQRREVAASKAAK
mgnify:CR=1 FL=1